MSKDSAPNEKKEMATQITLHNCVYCGKEGPWYSWCCDTCLPVRNEVHAQILKLGVESYNTAEKRIIGVVRHGKKPKKSFFWKILDLV